MYYFVFQVLIERGGADVDPFAIHLFCGMVMVHFFTETFNGGTRSLVSNGGLIVKLPMPRELFPVATHAGGLLAHGADGGDHDLRQRAARLDARPGGLARGGRWRS